MRHNFHFNGALARISRKANSEDRTADRQQLRGRTDHRIAPQKSCWPRRGPFADRGYAPEGSRKFPSRAEAPRRCPARLLRLAVSPSRLMACSGVVGAAAGESRVRATASRLRPGELQGLARQDHSTRLDVFPQPSNIASTWPCAILILRINRGQIPQRFQPGDIAAACDRIVITGLSEQ